MHRTAIDHRLRYAEYLEASKPVVDLMTRLHLFGTTIYVIIDSERNIQPPKLKWANEEAKENYEKCEAMLAALRDSIFR